MILKKQNFKVSMYIQRMVSVFGWSSQTGRKSPQGQIEIFFWRDFIFRFEIWSSGTACEGITENRVPVAEFGKFALKLFWALSSADPPAPGITRRLQVRAVTSSYGKGSCKQSYKSILMYLRNFTNVSKRILVVRIYSPLVFRYLGWVFLLAVHNKYEESASFIQAQS